MPSYRAIYLRPDAFAIVDYEVDGSITVQITGTFTAEEWNMILDNMDAETPRMQRGARVNTLRGVDQ